MEFENKNWTNTLMMKYGKTSDIIPLENKLLIVYLYNRFCQAAQNSIPIISQNPGGQMHKND